MGDARLQPGRLAEVEQEAAATVPQAYMQERIAEDAADEGCLGRRDVRDDRLVKVALPHGRHHVGSRARAELDIVGKTPRRRRGPDQAAREPPRVADQERTHRCRLESRRQNLDPPADTRISTLEVFGPVICVYSYNDVNAAIEQANSLPTAFQAAVFGRDIDRALETGRRLDASAVMINDHTAFRDDVMPFAGLRESGLGTGGIPYTLEDMQVDKMTVIKQR